jgi:hypothetical protein
LPRQERFAHGVFRLDDGSPVTAADIGEALHNTLLAGGRVNAKLLGGAQEMACA